MNHGDGVDGETPSRVREESSLNRFKQALVSIQRCRLDSQSLWHAFALAYPNCPDGERRYRLLHILEELDREGVIRLPSQSGRGWDSSLTPMIPRFVTRNRPPHKSPERWWSTFAWHPRLAWVARLTTLSTRQARFLRKVHEGLINGWFEPRAPLKYRSLQLCGDEKALHALEQGGLFGEGRLSLQILGCEAERPPMAWRTISKGGRILILENAGGFWTAYSVLSLLEKSPYDVVAWGNGNQVASSIGSLLDLGRPVESIDYVGDLDRDGLQIALRARETSTALGLPTVLPAKGIHEAMLSSAAAMGCSEGWPHRQRRRAREMEIPGLLFLPEELRPKVSRIIAQGNRIPEEVLGPSELRALWKDG